MSTSRRVIREGQRSQLLAGALPIVALAAAAACTAQSAFAVDIPLDPNSMELQLTAGTYKISQAQPQFGIRLGFGTNLGSGNVYGGLEGLLYFSMPAHAANQVVATTSLTFSENYENSTSSGKIPTFNIDLYGLGYETSNPPTNENIASSYTTRAGIASTNLSQDYFFAGPTQTGTTSTSGIPSAVGLPTTMLQDNILVPADWTAANLNTSGPTNGTGAAVHYSSAAGNNSLASFIQSAYTAGAVAGNYLMLRMSPDITSVPGNSASTATQRYYIDYAQTPTEPTTIGGSTFGAPNSTVPTLSVVFALPGDANFDGKINADDYALIDRGAAQVAAGTLAAGATQWSNGDFNHDGTVDAADYMIIDTAYAQSLGHAPADLLAERDAQFGDGYVSALVAAVPEPTTLGLAGLAGAMTLARRRKQIAR
ncbi:MAG TPA: dockerin type I domain-containing protein [Tepidisphaeraceae bacterium]|jgi:hypothetical protein|nr:dockerin type I domain-containing protein [Tepidisphaeraceae bacterium]